MVRSAATRRTVVGFTGVFADKGQKRLEFIGDFFGVNHQHLRHVGDQNQGHKVFFNVVVQLGVHGGRNSMVHGAHKQGVAIGSRFGCNACT